MTTFEPDIMEEKRTHTVLLAHLSTFASFKTLSIKSSILNTEHLFLHSCVKPPPAMEILHPPQIFFFLCGTSHEKPRLITRAMHLKDKGRRG